jgi:hypothetical protein
MWLALGTVPIPLLYRSKTPKIRWQEFQTRPPTDDELRSWFQTRLANMAVITGWHGLTVIDFDDWDVFDTWCRMFGMPDTYMIRTARGVHAYYYLKEPTKTVSLGKIDIKGKWGYVLVPPSIHPTGIPYRNLYRPTHIKRVDSLVDIVPESMLPAETSPVSTTPQEISQEISEISDPFAAAMAPRVYTGGGKVADIRARYRIEDLFPDREST